MKSLLASVVSRLVLATLFLFKGQRNGSYLLACSAFISPMFNADAPSRKAPSKILGVELEMPNFDELFDRIQQVSPLARLAISKKEGGFAALDPGTHSFILLFAILFQQSFMSLIFMSVDKIL